MSDEKDDEVKVTATNTLVINFVEESNHIEGIYRAPSWNEISETQTFLDLSTVRVRDLENFVHVCAGAKLRLKPGMDVRVGDHLPPLGGPGIGYSLDDLVRRANDSDDPYSIHCEYETLHPFMDGNGRSGRVLWAWTMLRQNIWPGINLGFLHAWYYQSLSRKAAEKAGK